MMGNFLWLASLFVVLTLRGACLGEERPPNIVLVVADDLGWNDVGFHNPDIKSPNIDKLAKEGVILNQSYVQPLCSPSRAALMTGVYPHRMGLQHLVIVRGQKVCVPLNRTFLPEVLHRAGYSTHMVGKWHLGFCDWKCTPLQRGFDSFYGFYNAMEDYYSKTYAGGFDFRDNNATLWSANGTYSTYLYTERVRKIIRDHDASKPLFLYLPHQNVHDPLEVPSKYTDLYPNIQDRKRKLLSGMVTALDDAVGDLVASLKEKGIYNNTLIVFTADNGGWVSYGGNNYPLRGGKFSLFEGGTRAVSFVHGPMFTNRGVKYDGIMHMVDWFPTLAEAAGVMTYDAADQDGVSQWQSLLSLTTPSKRNEVLYNMDLSADPIQGRAAIRVGDYKLIAGFPGMYWGWYKPDNTSLTGAPNGEVANVLDTFSAWAQTMGPITNVTEALESLGDVDAPMFQFLFNLKDDPNERNNIYDSKPDIVAKLRARLDAHKSTYQPPNFPLPSPNADPAKWGGAWTPGWCPNIH